MHLEELHLEVTRNCTLECEHCLRGDRERINMSSSVLDEIVKDGLVVDRLLLTGGEPLLAIQILEYLVELLASKRISVKRLVMITNGTIMSPRVLNVLYKLEDYTIMTLKLSTDIFHELQLHEKGLYEKREVNLAQFKNEDFYDFSEYGKEDKKYIHHMLTNKGRTKTMSDLRMAEIGNMLGITYLRDATETIQNAYIENGRVYGTITVDVYGNVVDKGLSFKEEDDFAYEHGLNVMDMPFCDAIVAYLSYNEKLRENSLNKHGKRV